MDLNFYQKNMELLYYQNLKTYNKDSSIMKKIEKEMSILEKSLKETNNSVDEEKILELETKISETEESYFYKPWNKISTVHKIIKLKEYVRELELENSHKLKLINFLKNALKLKKISKNDQVLYNITNAQIISIPKLNISNNNFSINL
tara:strand:- start:2911 stop:3354 length:444 start_codon:yes stop_codon:yes gene_type:complete